MTCAQDKYIQMGRDYRRKCAIHKLPKILPSLCSEYGMAILGINVGLTTYPGQHFQRYFQFYNISHLIDGDGVYWTPEKGEQLLHPGQCTIVSPGSIHWYGATEKSYTEDSISFYGPLADFLFKKGYLNNGVREMGPGRRLLPIIELSMEPSINSQIKANILLQLLILDIYHENLGSKVQKRESVLDALFQQIKSDNSKWWTVSEMAEFCNLSEPQFRRVFRATTNTSPKNYLDELKIRQSCEALASTELKISEIARLFGYLDPFHFSRRFKKLCGISPDQYREERRQLQSTTESAPEA